ncbi:RluA family pseudouridine synthase [bacterium]|nr:RluA family pseudouridine synthase [bacterium]
MSSAEGRSLDLQVDAGDLGERIDRFVASRVRSLSRTFVATLVERGLVTVNGEAARRVSQRLQRAGHVRVVIPASEEGTSSLRERVIHEDAAILVVDKPAGLPVKARLKLAGDDAVSAARRLLVEMGKDASFLGTPHRLDRATSGVLVFALTKEAARALSGAFASRKTKKTYLAWVAGAPSPRSGAIEARILAPGDGEARIDERGKPARTRYRVLREDRGRALLALRLLTGRTHQLRLHLAHVGHPIVGDDVHGDGIRGAGRLLLHARRLRLVHPITGERLVLDAPWDESPTPLT